MSQNSTEAPERPRTASKAAWKKRSIHEGVTLPSGAVVSIKLPDLGHLLKVGTIPNELVEQALKHRTEDEEKITPEVLQQTWDYTCLIVPIAVVDPKIEPDDVPDLPKQDLQMILGFCSRSTDMDAVGHQLGGLETSKQFRDSRGILSVTEALGGMPGD